MTEVTDQWEFDDATMEQWVATLRRALASEGHMTKAPGGWPGWSLCAARLPNQCAMVCLWEPGAPRPPEEGPVIPDPGLLPTILLMVGPPVSGAAGGFDRRSPEMQTDEHTALTIMTVVGQAWAVVVRGDDHETGSGVVVTKAL